MAEVGVEEERETEEESLHDDEDEDEDDDGEEDDKEDDEDKENDKEDDVAARFLPLIWRLPTWPLLTGETGETLLRSAPASQSSRLSA